MLYRSTKDKTRPVSFSQALLDGIAPDGGLYLPEKIVEMTTITNVPDIPEFAATILRPYFQGDLLEPLLDEICSTAFTFPMPLTVIDDRLWLLELFHGPTAAFKDFGARFLADCFVRLHEKGLAGKKPTILVATSGDTGGAVAAAFSEHKAIDVFIFFPKDGVSPEQKHQLTCWGGNIHSIAVEADFDGCQNLVKRAFADLKCRRIRQLSSANSINIGRLLPQMLFYARSALQYVAMSGKHPVFIVPTGNLGNAVACLIAFLAGFPIRAILCSCNANRTLPEFFESGIFKPRKTVQTLANAMDVGNPNNFSRLGELVPDFTRLGAMMNAVTIDDSTITSTIVGLYRKTGRIVCPHTATSIAAAQGLDDTTSAIAVATAHPAKFVSLLEPLLGVPIPPPPALEAIAGRPSSYQTIPPDLDAVRLLLS